MIKPGDLSWDDIVSVGPKTLGGNYLRQFWWPVALSEEADEFAVAKGKGGVKRSHAG